MSIHAVSVELGLSKSAVRKQLIKAGVPLRLHSHFQTRRDKKAKAIALRTAPYGYCLIQGQLIEEPKEQHILKLILRWERQGMSQTGIARQLNEQKLMPRSATKWSQPTVGFIIKRHLENN